MKLVSRLTIVLLAVASLVLVGCASQSGGSAPASTDVNADVLTEGKILAAIADDPGLDSTAIGVSCINGVVTLRGSVGSAIERELAGRVASGISGVSNVTNLLTF